MEDPEEEWGIQEYYPCSSGEEDEFKISKVRWIWNAGLNLGKKVVITGFVMTSAPVVLPPLVFVSALGFAVSVPFGVVFASYACTEKLMSKLLPMPDNPSLLICNEMEEEEFEFGEEIAMEEEEKRQMEDVKEGIEMRMELPPEDRQEEHVRVENHFGILEKGYEDVGEYQERDDEGPPGGKDVKIQRPPEEVDKKPLIEESKNEEASPELKQVTTVVVSGEKKHDLKVESRVIESNKDESAKKNKKKNKHHSKKSHHGIVDKKEDTHENGKSSEVNQESGGKSIGLDEKERKSKGSSGAERRRETSENGISDENEGEISSNNNKMNPSEEKIWEEINALRVIVGYKATPHKSFIGELKALYIFTGVEPPSSFDKSTDVGDAKEKLHFLMSIVGVK